MQPYGKPCSHERERTQQGEGRGVRLGATLEKTNQGWAKKPTDTGDCRYQRYSTGRRRAGEKLRRHRPEGTVR